jgi:tetratricopeptide (TPR) repeat protein/tRNA A-37 threonylcarbamoyl transferase component Bud32
LGTGSVLAGRYAIVQLLALGGMGAVYEVEDLHLHERVALKVVRPELLGDPVVVERFKREVQLSRKVTHTNVCRIFDLGTHRDEAAGWEVTFLTMELLRGRTLQERIQERGRMSPDEALPLICQMAAALDAAHRAGVIHRDLKTANVLVVPGMDGERAVVTDFGLALPEFGGVELSASGQVVGTAVYMSPEQAQGLPATTQSDIYSLGVVIFEMVTGAWPHVGETAFSLLARRLTEPATSPKALAPELPEPWEKAILRCLERMPEDRFASSLEVARALAGGTACDSPKRTRHPRARSLAFLAGGAALALVLQLIGDRQPANGSFEIRPARIRPAVAVLGFKNLSGLPEAAWLSAALTETMAAELSAGDNLRLVPSETVHRMKTDLALLDAESFGTETLGKIRRNTGTDFVVTGTYLAAGENAGSALRLDVRLQDAATGKILASVTANDTEAALLALVTGAGVELREKLGVGHPTAKEDEGVRAALPEDPEAARLYAEGLDRLRRFDLAGARDVLTKCTERAPQYAAAHAALSDAHLGLGWENRAAVEAQKAFELSAGLPRALRLELESRSYERTGKWAKAIEGYSTLFRFYPDDVEHALRLIRAQLGGGRPQHALATIAALRQLPPHLSDDPRIDLAEARVADRLGELDRSSRVASEAVHKAEHLDARLLRAEAQLLVGRGLLEVGQPEEAWKTVMDAMSVSRAAGDLGGVAGALRLLIPISHRLGNVEEMLRLAETMLPLARTMGNRNAEAVALTGIGGYQYLRGELRKGRGTLEKVLSLNRELGIPHRIAVAATNLADVDFQMGELARARASIEEALGIHRGLENQEAVAGTLILLSGIRLACGEAEKARQNAEEAVAISRRIGVVSWQNQALQALGRVARAEGWLEQAREYYETVQASHLRAKERTLAAQCTLDLAAISLDEGKGADAEALVREALPTLEGDAATVDRVRAHESLARALLLLGKSREAKVEIDRATELARKSGTKSGLVSTAIIGAQVSAAVGKSEKAILALGKACDQAQRDGFVVLQLEAELALGKLELKQGADESARALLQNLEKAARARGLGLLARQAAEAARS